MVDVVEEVEVFAGQLLHPLELLCRVHAHVSGKVLRWLCLQLVDRLTGAVLGAIISDSLLNDGAFDRCHLEKVAKELRESWLRIQD